MTKKINWIELTNENQLKSIQEESQTQPVVIFKHSTSCSISRATLDRLERNWKQEDLLPVKSYFLDLLSYRKISNEIASTFNVDHESPQILLIKNGKSVYDKSHFEIDFAGIKNAVNAQPLAKN